MIALHKIDWLNTKAILMMGEESQSVTAKVIGILENGYGDEAVAYISLNSAKALLKASGQPVIYQQASVRVKNSARADSVMEKLTALKLITENAKADLRARWDSWTKEMMYLFFIGAFGLACYGALLTAWRQVAKTEQKETYAALYLCGMKKRWIASLFLSQAMAASLIGAGAGILIATLLS